MHRKLLIWSAAILLWAGSCLAQFTSGIEGTVTDPSGVSVPAAAIAVSNPPTGVTRTVAASGNGYYRIGSLAAVKVTVTAPGFKTAVRENVALTAAGTRTLNVTLEIGSAESTVTITGEAPLVDLSEGRISGIIEQTKIRELPLVGRNIFTLVILTPGVTGLANGGNQSFSSTTGDIFTTDIYASTALGIQVCDTQGRTVAILNQPPAGIASEIALSEGSENFLYARSGGRFTGVSCAR